MNPAKPKTTRKKTTKSYWLGLSYGEWQAWYAYGVLRIPKERLVVPTSQRPQHKEKFIEKLLGWLPQLMLDDEEGVLLTQLAPLDASGNWVELPISAILQVVPLTTRAGRILDTRLSPMGVRLAPACFEAEVVDAWQRYERLTMRRGGDALVSCCWPNQTMEPYDNNLVQAMDKSVIALRATTLAVPAQPFSWVSAAFAYTRHEPYGKRLPNQYLSYLYDAGKVLKQVGVNVDDFRSVIKQQLSNSLAPQHTLPELLALPELNAVAYSLREQYPQQFPASLAALGLLLRWKEQYHRRREQLDIETLRQEVAQAVLTLGIEPVRDAVWLLGCWAGHERVAPSYYQAQCQKYRWLLPSGQPNRPSEMPPLDSMTPVQTQSEIALLPTATQKNAIG